MLQIAPSAAGPLGMDLATLREALRLRHERGEVSARTLQAILRRWEAPVEPAEAPGLPAPTAEDADERVLSGAVRVETPLRSPRLTVAGAVTALGPVETDELELDGLLVAERGMSVGRAEVRGVLEARGILLVYELRLRGTLRAESEASFQTLLLRGELAVRELSAQVAQLRLERSSRARRLEVEELSVEPVIGTAGALQVESIQGRSVVLDAVTADRVDGDLVRVGPGCRIEELVGRELLVHRKAQVGRLERLT